MTRKNSTPRLEDVAKRAGVHAATVSRFFSNPAVVSPAAAARIGEAVTELGYTRNFVAGSLASNQRRLVAILVSGLAYTKINEAIETITAGLMEAGTNVMLCISGGDPIQVERQITTVLSWRVDAVISWVPISKREANLLRSSGTTYLQITDASVPPIDVSIGFGQAELGAALARFVLERGYRQPHLIATVGYYSELRHNAFLMEWKRLVKENRLTMQQLETHPSFEAGRRVFERLRQMDPHADIVVCPSDYIAQALVIEANAIGLQVPKDLAVIGFGNSPMTHAMRPTITTVDLHTERVAVEVLRTLQARSRGEKFESKSINVGFTILTGDSA